MGGAEYSRDALAKGIFSRIFDWLVAKVNSTMEISSKGKSIGILDIYGFEIFERNQFEQLCINYCNETLHQIFIDLTLKAEQEEYVREGIKWEPVKYVNNKPCVDLINGKPLGIFTMLDEECLFPEGTDASLLQKLHKNFGKVAHYQIPSGNSNKHFVIKHYAGDVAYDVNGFLDRNRDTLYADLQQMCISSSNFMLKQLFSKATEEIPMKGGKKRPVTAGFQFKTSVGYLLTALYACQPHYIRCIKPNEEKKPLGWDEKKVAEQIKYLGLWENLQVRRAGYCYRQTFEKLLDRYYFVCDATFPRWKGAPIEGVSIILKELGLPAKEWQLGKTKVFVRSPQTLFEMEEKRIFSLNRIATKIQKVWRAWRIRKVYLALRNEALDVFKGQKERTRQSMARGVVAFFGDFLGFQEDNEIMGILRSNGDSKVVFSEVVNKVNKRLKIQERILVMTDKAVYNFVKLKKPKKGQNYELKRRIEMRGINGISVSKLADNFFVIHVPAEYDYVYETANKTVFITLLKREYSERLGRPLDIKVVESIAYRLKSSKENSINFAKNEAAVMPDVKKVKGQLQVGVQTGVKQ